MSAQQQWLQKFTDDDYAALSRHLTASSVSGSLCMPGLWIIALIDVSVEIWTLGLFITYIIAGKFKS